MIDGHMPGLAACIRDGCGGVIQSLRTGESSPPCNLSDSFPILQGSKSSPSHVEVLVRSLVIPQFNLDGGSIHDII
jgi:hypothetical protein